MITKAHVVMRNDFPAAVYDNKTEAEARCFIEREAELEQRKGWPGPSIFWNIYSVPLNPPEPPK